MLSYRSDLAAGDHQSTAGFQIHLPYRLWTKKGCTARVAPHLGICTTLSPEESTLLSHRRKKWDNGRNRHLVVTCLYSRPGVEHLLYSSPFYPQTCSPINLYHEKYPPRVCYSTAAMCMTYLYYYSLVGSYKGLHCSALNVPLSSPSRARFY